MLNRYTQIIAALVALIVASATAAHAEDFVLDEATFDSWLLSSTGINRSHGTRYRDFLEEQAQLQIATAENATELTDDQQQKIKLATSGDTALIVEEIEKLRSELIGQSFPQNNINEPYQKIQALGSQLNAGMYGPDSLTTKVLNQVLTDEQHAAIDRLEAERRQRQHEASLNMLIAGLQRFCPMTESQRTAFLKLAIDNTKPAPRSHHYERYLLLYQLNEIPQDQVKAIFDDAQYKSLEPALRQGNAYRHMLEQQGLIVAE